MIYAKAGPEVVDQIRAVMEQYHGALFDRGVTVDAILAEPNEGNGAAIKVKGYPAVAVIKINSVKQRLQGAPDATITIDRNRWVGMSAARRDALLDHELCHLEISLDEYGKAKLDDAGRPKLRSKPHDFELGVFDVVVHRHGDQSIDAQVLKHAAERKVQASMAFN